MKNLHSLQKANPYLCSCQILCSSDAHYLWDIHEPFYQLYAESKDIPYILGALSTRAKNKPESILFLSWNTFRSFICLSFKKSIPG